MTLAAGSTGSSRTNAPTAYMDSPNPWVLQGCCSHCDRNLRFAPWQSSRPSQIFGKLRMTRGRFLAGPGSADALRPVVSRICIRGNGNTKLILSGSPEDSWRYKKSHFVIHGQADRNIPVRHSRRIAARTRPLLEVPSADHCGALGALSNLNARDRLVRTKQPRASPVQ